MMPAAQSIHNMQTCSERHVDLEMCCFVMPFRHRTCTVLYITIRCHVKNFAVSRLQIRLSHLICVCVCVCAMATSAANMPTTRERYDLTIPRQFD